MSRNSLIRTMAFGWALLLACLLTPRALAQILITSPTTIAATNLAFENKAITVSGTTLTIDGTHRFQSLLLTNGASLTHPTNTPTPPHLILAEHLSVAADSAVQLSGRGALRGQGHGAGPTSSCCSAGGSHGGRGGPSENGLFGLTHGSIFEPTALGSGGGSVEAGIRGGALCSTNPSGELIVDRSPLDKDTVPTEFWGPIQIPGSLRIRSGGGTVHVVVMPDSEPPRLESALASPSMTEITAAFSDVLDGNTAEDITHYTLSGSARVLTAQLQTDLSTVLLTTTPLTGGGTYALTVSNVRNGLGVPVADSSNTASFVARGTLRGLARRDVFYGISGNRLSHLYADPRWAVSPDLSRDVPRLAANRDDIDGDQLGARITGHLIPESTGWHRFFMASDDNGVFYLSENHAPANLRLVASEPLLGYPGEWTASARAEVTTSRGIPPANVSSPLWLEAGRHYWFDARFKEGSSTEHLAVTWQAPGEAPPRPNEGTRLTGERIARPASDAGPQILVQPAGGEFLTGSTVTLRVNATGTGTLRFQWYLGSTPINCETRDSLVLANLSAPAFGIYRVRVTDSVGAVDRSLAAIQRGIPPEPVFTESPQGRIVALGENVLLSGSAEGASPLTYQWRLNGQEIFGATNNLLATREDTAGEPRHVGKRGGRSLWLTWRAPASGVATFSTTGSSFDTLLAIYGGTSLASLQPVASDEDSGGFLTSIVRFNAIAGTDYSIAVDGFADAAGVGVLSWDLDPAEPPLPVLLQQPASVLGAVGDPIQFSVAFTPATASVQWLFNDRELTGQTAANLTINPVTPAQAGTYRARLRTPEGAVLESASAVLEVTDRPQAAGTLSANKLDDLFPEGASVALGALALHDLELAANLPVSVGLPGSQWTDNSQSSRGGEDAELCQAFATATRWFRIRFNVPGAGATAVRLTTDGSELPSLVAVFTNRTNLRMIACDAALPPQKPSVAVQFGARHGVDYLVLVDGIQGRRGPIKLNWSGEEEAPPQVTLREGRFHVEMRVAPALYDWQVAMALGTWQTVLRTNLPSGVFQFHDALPATEAAHFFRLVPANP